VNRNGVGIVEREQKTRKYMNRMGFRKQKHKTQKILEDILEETGKSEIGTLQLSEKRIGEGKGKEKKGKRVLRPEVKIWRVTPVL
jgi:hypothetical protein